MFKTVYEKIKTKYRGEIHHNWKGDKAGIGSLHEWIKYNYGTPKICVDCGSTSAKKYDWANISGKYKRDINDFKRLCVNCHKKLDAHLIPRGESHPFSRLKEKDILTIRELYKTGFSASALSKTFDVSKGHIQNIVQRKSWKHI